LTKSHRKSRQQLFIAVSYMVTMWLIVTPNGIMHATAAIYPERLTAPQPPRISAISGVLMDASTGQILYTKNSNERRDPASTTKIMSIYLAFQMVAAGKIAWTTEIPVTPDAYKVAVEPGVSDAYLDPKEHFTLQQMMSFITVLSANDAMVAVADKIAGSQANFVAMMNREAQVLGLSGTHYMNPDGLPSPNHYTTPMNLALLARALINTYPEVLKYTSMQQVTVRKGQTWRSTDELLGHYPGLDGLKTGFTDGAGFCYVSTAEQNGRRLIAVVMGDKTNHQRFKDVGSLLDYGFQEWQQVTVVKKGADSFTAHASVAQGVARSVPVVAAESLVMDVPRQNLTESTKTHVLALKAPVKKGQVIGHMDYLVGNLTVASTPLIAGAVDKRASWWTRFWRHIAALISHLLHRL